MIHVFGLMRASCHSRSMVKLVCTSCPVMLFSFSRRFSTPRLRLPPLPLLSIFLSLTSIKQNNKKNIGSLLIKILRWHLQSDLPRVNQMSPFQFVILSDYCLIDILLLCIYICKLNKRIMQMKMK